MKDCILIPAVSLMMLGCGNKRVKQTKQADDDSTELIIKTPYDTVEELFNYDYQKRYESMITQ